MGRWGGECSSAQPLSLLPPAQHLTCTQAVMGNTRHTQALSAFQQYTISLGHPHVPTDCPDDRCAMREHKAPWAWLPALPHSMAQQLMSVYPAATWGLGNARQGRTLSEEGTTLLLGSSKPSTAGLSPARDCCARRETQTSAIDTDYKQSLLHVNTASGS